MAIALALFARVGETRRMADAAFAD